MKRNVVLTAMLVLGFVFLYVPIAVLVVYSFNANRLVTVWGGWSLRWYAALFHDAPLIRAAWLSVRLAFVTGVASAVLGTLAGIALGRRGGFAGRRLFATMIGGPIVLPDVVLGLALLLLFVAVQSVTGFPAQRGTRQGAPVRSLALDRQNIIRTVLGGYADSASSNQHSAISLLRVLRSSRSTPTPRRSRWAWGGRLPCRLLWPVRWGRGRRSPSA